MGPIMQHRRTLYLGCIFLVFLPSALSDPVGSGRPPVEQRCEENPFAFPLKFPAEVITEGHPNSRENVREDGMPPKLALHWFDESDLLNAPNFTDPFRGNATDYVEARATNPKTLWSAYHTDEDDAEPTTSEHYDRSVVKKSYLDDIRTIETRIRTTLSKNLKAVLWLDLVNLFNANLVFRYFMLENKKVMHLVKNDHSILQDVPNIISFGRRVTLPESITPPDEESVEKLQETFNLFHELALKDAAGTLSMKDDQVICTTETFHDNELYKEAKSCLQRKLADTNRRWQSYEKIVDHIRSKFNATKRTCSKLYNPVARWM